MEIRRLVVLLVMTTLGWVAQSADATPPPGEPQSLQWHVGSTWAVLLFSEDHQLVGSFVVRFTAEKAVSCIAGDWKRLEVLKRHLKDTNSFLATRPLAYNLEQGKFTLGVTEVCDGYVFLRGVVNEEGLTGDYGALGLGGFDKVGSFAAAKIKD